MTRCLPGRTYAFGPALLLCALALLLTAAPAAFAQGGKSQAGGLPALEKRVAAMEALILIQSDKIAALETKVSSLEAKNQAQDQTIAALQTANAALAARATTLETKTQYLSVQGTETYLTGTNLHIRNGLGATNGNPGDPRATAAAATAVNGLGNLIIGYNAPGGLADFPRDRTGSHCLVVGDFNYYTSFGGIVAGRDNVSTGPYASALGGRSNRAAADFSSVVGGAFNVTDGSTASILGGDGNRASAIDSVVCGGAGNRAMARFSVVGGGGGVVQGTELGWSAGSFGPALQGAFRSP